ncbi:MAG TPA: glycosyltransferase family 4 protein [Thiolinea sp.]|nr:glycosyltransferase family 4 protein [Thiolinea sp.]
MKVLHLVKTTAGAAWALRQLRELAALGVEAHVALPSFSGRAADYERLGIRVHVLDTDLKLRQPWRIPGQALALRRLVRTLEPDLVHSHFVGTTLLMRLALHGLPIPRLFQVPGPLHLEHAFFRRMELLSADWHDYWMASCEWTRRAYLAAGIESGRVFLSYYGTDPLPLSPVSGQPLRTGLNCSDTTILVGMVAYMYAPRAWLGQQRGLKGHEDLIDALAIVRRRYPDLMGVFVGGGWNGADAYEVTIRAYARERLGDHAVFLGNRKDVFALYPQLDMAVHPSHSENVGGAAESLLLGVPTIATRVGGFPDLVRPGQTGLLVPPRAPEALAQAICHYIEAPDLARRHARQGQQLAMHLFDVQRTAREVHEAYRRIIDTDTLPYETATPQGGL